MTIRGPFAAVVLVLLFVSVTANLVIAGFVVGRFAGPRPEPGEIERIVTLGTRSFPKAIRDDIVTRSNEQRDALRQKWVAVESARRDMFAAMRADPYDPAELDARYEALRVATDALQRAGQEIVAQALAEASPEDRSAIRQRRTPPPPRPPRDGDRPPRDGGERPPR